ncbi:MAG: PEP-CTERM sorting domain-containing protein [Pseudomonadota bacterium]
MKKHFLLLASGALMGLPTFAQATILSTVTQFADSTYATYGGVTNSNASSYMAPPPTSSTAHNYQTYNSDEEVRMYATASTHPGTSLSFGFGHDGLSSYSLYSRSNTTGSVMRAGETFHLSVDLTNDSADWLDLTLTAWHGMRYGMYTYERYLTGGLDGAEYMRLNADFSLMVDGVEVWERVFDRTMDTSGSNPYAFLSNQNPPPDTVSNILLGTWAPNETKTLELLFSGFAETNALASTNAYMSMAPLFNYQNLLTTPGQPVVAPPPTGSGGGGNVGGGGTNPVPEPSSLALLGLGLGLLGVSARRRT